MIEVTIKAGTLSSEWQRLATKKARAEAIRQGIPWNDAVVYVHLPERGRCMTKSKGRTELIAHG